MEARQETLYIVEVGSAGFHFENLQAAADFFSLLSKAPIKNIQTTYEAGKSLVYLKEGPIGISMKQQLVNVYPSLKAAKFAAANEPAV